MIGIIGAMDEEVAILKESMEVQDTMERAGMTFVEGIMKWQGSCSCKKWYRKSQHGNLRTDSD